MNYPLLTVLAFALLAVTSSPAAPLPSRDLAPATDGAFRFGQCHASLQAGVLRIGNGRIERTWRVEGDGSLTTHSLLDSAQSLEWVAGSGSTAPATEPPPCALTAESGPAGPTEEPSLLATLRVHPGTGGPIYRFQIFANTAAIVADRTLAGPPAVGAAALGQLNRLESFTPAPAGWTLTRVRIFGRTDLHEGPVVIERPGLAVTAEDTNDSERIADGARFRGNVFFIEDPRTSAGVLWLKYAPLADERPRAIDDKGAVVQRLFDLTVAHGQVMLDSHELAATGGQTYRTVSLVYQGGRAGRIAALQRYHRQMRTYQPGRDGLILCNSWGEWNSRKNLSAPFLVREIDAAAKLGVDVFQIDAGWQNGSFPETVDRTKRNTVGHYGISPRYWNFHPEILPNGLKPLVAQARAHGMQFGLWFSPDSFNELGAWEKDKARVLELHAEGASYFKFDLLRIFTPRAEDHFQRLVEELIHETGGRLTIDLDVTGGHSPRPGYFGNPHHGPIFVENRFTNFPLNAPPGTPPSDFWPRKDRYFPHCTLRNLWLLAQYFDPVRLRMEFMNNLRNQDLYGDDPLAPAHWSPEYVFATVMCSSPLAWMEVQQLPAVYVEKVAPLVAIWKAHREAMFRGDLIPIGTEPNGHAWTGFFSAAPDRTGGYALLFREDNDITSFELPLPLLTAGNFEVTTLAGQGTARVNGDRLHVELPAARSFVFLKLQRK